MYVPSGLSAAPPHVLYFKNGSTYWVIHPDHVSLEAAGAPASPTGDCALAMQNVLNYLVWAQRAKLQLWERDYYLSYAAILTQSSPDTDPLLDFSIIGRGRGVSRLLIPWTPEPLPPGLGAFKITFSHDLSTFLARDFSVIATNATASNDGCGTAMLVNFPGVVGAMAPGRRRSAIVTHVEIGNDGVETDNVTWAYFAVGMDLTGAGHLLLFDVTFAGPEGQNSLVTHPCGSPDPVERDYADESPAFLPTCHLVIDDCYDPHLISLKLWSAQTGISHVTTGVALTGQGPQGFYMSDVRFTVFKTCFVHSQTRVDDTPVQCPDGMIQDCYFSFRDAGLNLANCLQWRVSGCEFSSLGDGYNVGGDCNQQTAYDLVITDANIVAITGCRFNVIAAPNRVNIQINPPLTPSDIQAQRFLIAHNQFGDNSDGTFGVSAVQVLGTANDIQIGHNDYIGTYSGPIVDDQTGSGAVVALLGYPAGGSVAVGAVVPNGGSSGNNPTLGSAAVPWPKTFNQLHCLPITLAPIANPSDGWVLYTDSTTGFLMAWNGTTFKQLAP